MDQRTRQDLDERISIWLSASRDLRLVKRALKSAGVTSKTCRGIDALCKHIAAGAGGVILEESSLTPAAIDQLRTQLRNEPAWSDLPLIVFTSAGEAPGILSQASELVSEVGNVNLVELPIRVPTFLSTVRAALRGRRLQYQSRDLLLQQQQTVQRLGLLTQVANHFLLTDKPKEVVGSVFNKISSHLALEVYLHYLYDPARHQLFLNAVGGVPDEQAIQFQTLSVTDTSICGAVAERRCLIVADDVQRSADPRFRLVRALGLTAYVCYPLVANDELIGTLSFGTRCKRQFKHEELMLMEAVCHQVAVAIQRQRTEEALYDLTQQLDRRVQDRTAQLQETSDQMEAFCYSISHDLRAPLRTIRGFSQAIIEDYASVLDGAGQDYLRRVMSGAEKMDSLIQDLLEYSRIGRSRLIFEEVNLETGVDKVLHQFDEEIELKHARVVIHKPLVSVRGHGPTLEQMLINLLSNALKFISPGVEPEIQIRTTETDRLVRIWVEDNGIGIAPENHLRIFGVFERLHGVEAYPGTGIGLAIVAKGAARMGGRAGVESGVGAGSRFWIELAKAEDADSDSSTRSTSR